jgi:hypothetical protein
MSHSVEAVKLRTAYKELEKLTDLGTDYYESLRHVKSKYKLENSIDLEIKYASRVYLIDRTDEVIDSLAHELQDQDQVTVKQSFLDTLKTWIAHKKAH